MLAPLRRSRFHCQDPALEPQIQPWSLRSSSRPQIQAWSLRSNPEASDPALEPQIQPWRTRIAPGTHHQKLNPKQPESPPTPMMASPQNLHISLEISHIRQPPPDTTASHHGQPHPKNANISLEVSQKSLSHQSSMYDFVTSLRRNAQ